MLVLTDMCLPGQTNVNVAAWAILQSKPLILAMLSRYAEPTPARGGECRGVDPFVSPASQFLVLCERELAAARAGAALHEAAWVGAAAAWEPLLRAVPGAAGWAAPGSGLCAVHVAARRGDAGLLLALLAAGADPRARSARGFSALHVAAWSNSAPCARLLLAAGCDLRQKVLCILRELPQEFFC